MQFRQHEPQAIVQTRVSAFSWKNASALLESKTTNLALRISIKCHIVLEVYVHLKEKKFLISTCKNYYRYFYIIINDKVFVGFSKQHVDSQYNQNLIKTNQPRSNNSFLYFTERAIAVTIPKSSLNNLGIIRGRACNVH